MCFVFGIHLRYVGDIMKKFFLLFTALFLFFASGCQVTPEIKIGYDGVTKAENENDRVIESIHNKVPTVTFEFESSHINKKITNNNFVPYLFILFLIGVNSPIKILKHINIGIKYLV